MAQRGKNVFFSILGVSAAVGLLGYFQTRTTWRTATRAEVLAVIDPSLARLEAEDPAARARYDRLEIVLKGARRPPADLPLRNLPFEDQIRINSIEQILNEGPLQRPLPSWDLDSLITSGRYTIGVQMMTRAAVGELITANADSAARLFALAFRLAYAFGDTASTKIEVLMRDHHASGVLTALYPLLPLFEDRQLARIAAAIPPTPLVEEGMKRAIRAEFQGLSLSVIPDPAAWNREAQGKVAADQKSTLAEHLELEELIGSYDALDTARQLSRAHVQAMENAGRRRFNQEDSVEKRIHYLRVTLPNDQTPSATGLWIRIRKIQYRIQMARASNSFARANLFVLAEGQRDLMDLSFRGRTFREGMHTLLALHRYRLQRGAPAPDLESLVKAKLLPRLPIDFLGRGNLQYDAKRHCLWSVGENGKDEGGTAFRANDLKGKDLLWKTP